MKKKRQWADEKKKAGKLDRCKRVNLLLETIGATGRKFYSYKVPKPDGQKFEFSRIARFEVDQWGRVWFHDHYTEKRIYTHRVGRWSGFTGGGTLLHLAKVLRDYIRSGRMIHPLDGRHWAYGDDFQKVHKKSVELGIVADK